MSSTAKGSVSKSIHSKLNRKRAVSPSKGPSTAANSLGPDFGYIRDWGAAREFADLCRSIHGPSAARLARIFDAENMRGWRRQTPSGFPDGSRLWRLATGSSTAVMRRRAISPAPRTAVMVLVDASASMGTTVGRVPMKNTRIGCAMAAAWSLAKTIESAGHKCAVATFGYEGRATTKADEAPRGNGLRAIVGSPGAHPTADDEALAKGWSSHVLPPGVAMVKPIVATINYVKRWTSTVAKSAPKFVFGASYAPGNTPLYQATLAAAGELDDVHADRRILVVLTDGEGGLPRIVVPASADASVMYGVPFVAVYASLIEQLRREGQEVVVVQLGEVFSSCEYGRSIGAACIGDGDLPTIGSVFADRVIGAIRHASTSSSGGR